MKSDIQDTIQRLESKMQKEFSDLHKEVTEYKKIVMKLFLQENLEMGIGRILNATEI